MELFTPWHIIIVVVVGAMLYFGGNRMPDMARSFGRSLRVFKTEIKGLAEDDKAREAAKDAPAPVEGDVSVAKAIEAPAAPVTATAPRVVAAPSEPIPVRAEVVRTPAAPAASPRPRPRPAGSAPRQ